MHYVEITAYHVMDMKFNSSVAVLIMPLNSSGANEEMILSIWLQFASPPLIFFVWSYLCSFWWEEAGWSFLGSMEGEQMHRVGCDMPRHFDIIALSHDLNYYCSRCWASCPSEAHQISWDQGSLWFCTCCDWNPWPDHHRGNGLPGRARQSPQYCRPRHQKGNIPISESVCLHPTCQRHCFSGLLCGGWFGRLEADSTNYYGLWGFVS